MAQLSLFKSKRQRGVKSPPAKEYVTHCMVADTLRRWQMPGWRWSHFPAGEYRHPATAMRLKRMGVQVGWPDFILLAPIQTFEDLHEFGGVHFLELKRKGSKLSEWQQSFSEFCVLNGYPYFWCDNYKDAINKLKAWGAVKASVSV
jgi:hypothetical protein